MRCLPQLLIPLAVTLGSKALAEPLAPSPAADAGVHVDAGTTVRSEHDCEKPRHRLALAADFAPYVGTSSSSSGRQAVRNFSFNLVGGYAAGVRGFELGSVLNLEQGCVDGVQIAGVANALGGSMTGLHVSGAANLVRGEVRGVQIAGAANVSGEMSSALQISGAANVVGADATGVQIAGGANVASGWARGLQLSGGANIAAAGLRGVQIAGALNFGGGDTGGLQLAPVNVSSGVVSGAQIGVVNIAEKSDLSLGVVSINTRGRTQVEGWSALESGIFAAAVKHGGNHWHGLYGLGTRTADPELTLVLGLGGDAPITERLYLGADVVGYWAPHFRESSEHASLIQPRAYLGFRVLKPLSVFAGASYNVFLASRRAENWAPDYAVRAETSGEPYVRLWPGAIVGVRLLPE
jgi:hypothetical protein